MQVSGWSVKVFFSSCFISMNQNPSAANAIKNKDDLNSFSDIWKQKVQNMKLSVNMTKPKIDTTRNIVSGFSLDMTVPLAQSPATSGSNHMEHTTMQNSNRPLHFL